MILIEEAHQSGARYWKACEVAGIHVRTLQRWKDQGIDDKRKGSAKRVVRKSTELERQEIVDVCVSARYRDLSPHQIVPLLLNAGIYLASVSTFYRVLKAENLLHHRENSRISRKQSKPPQRLATASNQVWTWDITWLSQAVKGLYYYAYVIMDIYDKSIIGWAIHDREDEQYAKELFESVTLGRQIRFKYLHSDNGGPMKGQSLLSFLTDLKVNLSFSRPRVSNDNPFSESLFRTVKYHRSYPRLFKSLKEARIWMADFVNWYNSCHLHSSIGYVTPHQLRYGESEEIFTRRNETMEQAKADHPERWGSREQKIWAAPEIVTLNPEKKALK